MESQYIMRGEHEEFAKRMEDEHHRMNVRIKDVEGKTNTLVELTTSVKTIAESVEVLTKKVAALERQPAENWKVVTKAALTAVGSAIGGGLVGMMAAYLIK